MSVSSEILARNMQTLAIVFAGIAAIAATWQGYVNWQSARTHYADNLQARQIDSCTEFLFHARVAIKSFRLWNELKEGKIIGRFDADPFRTRAIVDTDQVGAPLERMKLLSGSTTSTALDEVSNTNSVMQGLLADNSISGETDSRLDQYDKDLGDITERCRAVMLGRQVGLL